MIDRQAPAKFLIKRVVVVKVIIGFRHLQQALGANEILAFNKTIETSPAVAGIKKRDEILENSVGG
ncbi:MAG TPA: hypothetical protein VIQ51_12755 [Chryseosolibacter sp.]